MLNAFALIRPSERRATYSGFFILFGIMAGHALMETARDALFLSRLPASRLPWVYLGIAVLALGIFALQETKNVTGGKRRNPLIALLLGSAVITLGFWFLIGVSGPWVFYALYAWTGVFTTGVVVGFWTQIGALLTVPQAKRLFATIGVGSVLGAIVGSGIARVMTDHLEPRSLLLAAAAVLAATCFSVLLLPRPDDEAAPKKKAMEMGAMDWKRPLLTIWERPYLRRVGGILLLATVTLTLVDFLFKFSVAQAVEPERLGSFFAGTYLILNLLSLLTQITVVAWMVRTLGVSRVLSVLPLLLIGGSLAVLVGGGLAAALILKGFDGSLRHSLHRTATEVLFVPLTGDLRARIKGFIDVLGQRGGQALASLVILLVVLVGPVQPILAALVIGLGVAWIALAATLKTYYLNLFRETLSEVISLQPHLDFPELDLASLETLIAALNSPNDAEVLATLELLTEQDRIRLIPALILYHPSKRVVIRSLELFSQGGRSDFVPITDRLLEHHDPEVRAATLRTLAWVAPRPEIYATYADDPSPIVRVTALIGVVSYGSSRAAEARQAIEQLAVSGVNEEKLALARAIRFSPGAGYEDILLTLARAEHPRVKLEVAVAMHEIRSYRFIPALLKMLPDRRLRMQARASIVAMGTPVLEHLDRALADPHLDRAIRRQIPRTIAQFPPAEAAAVLMPHLLEETDGAVRYRTLRALGKLLTRDPDLSLDHPALLSQVEEALRQMLRLIQWQVSLMDGQQRKPTRDTPALEIILSLLEHKQDLALERLFRLLGLIYPRDDLRSIYRGTLSTDGKVRASSQELLEELLPSPIREAVLLLVDDLPDSERLRQAGPFRSEAPPGYAALLRVLLEKGGVGMRSLVVYHIGEMRMIELKKELEGVRTDSRGLVQQSVSRALARLAESSPA